MWISRPLVLFQCRHEEIHWSSLWLPGASSVAFTQRHWLHAVGSREMLPLCDGLPPAFSCAFTPQDTVLRLLAWPNIPSCSRLYWSCLGYHRTSRGWVLSQNKHCSDMGEWRKMDHLTADKESPGAFCKTMSSLNEESLEVLSGEPLPICMEKRYRGWASSWTWLVWCHGTYVEEVNTTDENTSQHTQVTAEGWQTRMHTPLGSFGFCHTVLAERIHWSCATVRLFPKRCRTSLAMNGYPNQLVCCCPNWVTSLEVSSWSFPLHKTLTAILEKKNQAFERRVFFFIPWGNIIK